MSWLQLKRLMHLMQDEFLNERYCVNLDFIFK